MRKVTKGSVTIKLWDLGGQPRFRSMWERYCRGVNAIVYVPRTRLASSSLSTALRSSPGLLFPVGVRHGREQTKRTRLWPPDASVSYFAGMCAIRPTTIRSRLPRTSCMTS
jgi:hypothetical protein